MTTATKDIGSFKAVDAFATALKTAIDTEGVPFTFKAGVGGKEVSVIFNPKEEGGVITKTVKVSVQDGNTAYLESMTTELAKVGLNIESASVRRARTDAITAKPT